MRLLYVAATRAQDRLILSGVATELAKLSGRPDTWLKWIWQSLRLEDHRESGLVNLAGNAQLQLTLNLPVQEAHDFAEAKEEESEIAESADSLEAVFPLLRSVNSHPESVISRFSVTHLINYQRCPRQYYFDRVLHLPSSDKLAVWNDAEAPEPPANLTAALKGAVIHRFCETYRFGEDPGRGVRSSLDEIIRRRRAELADRLAEIDRDAAVQELLPLAENYISSDLFRRVESARQETNGTTKPFESPGLWSELNFRLRRPLGILTGTIDKLLIADSPQPPLIDSVAIVAQDYQLQMQAYALAARALLPSLNTTRLKVTLHFLEPNVEYQLPGELLSLEACETAIDEAMLQLATSLTPEHFPTKPAHHCRMCNFLSICPSGLRFANREG
jgi:ATP-dependent exoDNAse (exonuclease V) beta subunit